jgi:hypothetical protein
MIGMIGRLMRSMSLTDPFPPEPSQNQKYVKISVFLLGLHERLEVHVLNMLSSELVLFLSGHSPDLDSIAWRIRSGLWFGQMGK